VYREARLLLLPDAAAPTLFSVSVTNPPKREIEIKGRSTTHIINLKKMGY
jgi:hypothetical protein